MLTVLWDKKVEMESWRHNINKKTLCSNAFWIGLLDRAQPTKEKNWIVFYNVFAIALVDGAVG